MKENKEIIESLLKFRNERDWAQFHNPKDLALAINVEAGELMHFFPRLVNKFFKCPTASSSKYQTTTTLR
jgi:hypothetical protein